MTHSQRKAGTRSIFAVPHLEDRSSASSVIRVGCSRSKVRYKPGPVGATLTNGFRFLDKTHGPIERFAYLPFGTGPRACIGAAFALIEATPMLATITQHFRLALAPGQTIWPVQGFTLGIRGGLRMTVHPN